MTDSFDGVWSVFGSKSSNDKSNDVGVLESLNEVETFAKKPVDSSTVIRMLELVIALGLIVLSLKGLGLKGLALIG